MAKKRERRPGGAGTWLDRALGAVSALMVALGCAALMWPAAAELLSSREQSGAVEAYDRALADMTGAEQDEAWEGARAFNASLRTGGVSDPFSQEVDGNPQYASMLDLSGEGSIATLRVPKVSLTLPVYQGTGEAALQKGAGHLEGTDLPVGGDGTHSVLTGHRGLPAAKLFTEVAALGPGDQVLVDVVGRTLAYEVSEVRVVEPDEDWGYMRLAGSDRLTLVTCTPFGQNTHRLLVHCDRVEWSPEDVQAASMLPHQVDPRVWGAAGGGAVLALVAGTRAVRGARSRRKVTLWTGPCPSAAHEDAAVRDLARMRPWGPDGEGGRRP